MSYRSPSGKGQVCIGAFVPYNPVTGSKVSAKAKVNDANYSDYLVYVAVDCGLNHFGMKASEPCGLPEVWPLACIMY